MVIVSVLAGVLFFVSFTLIPLSAARQVSRLRKECFKAILRQDMAFFDSKQPGELAAMVNASITEVQNGIAQKLVELVQASFQLILGFAIAFFFSWELSLVMLACIPLLGLSAGYIFSASATNDGMLDKESYQQADSIATETLSAMRTVSSFGGEVAMAKRYESHLGVARRAATRVGCKFGVGSASMFAIMFGFYGLGFWYGGKLVGESRADAIASYPAPLGLVNMTAVSPNPWSLHANIVGQICVDRDGNQWTGEALDSCACSIPWETICPAGGPCLDSPKCGCTHTTGGLLSPCHSVASIMTAFFSLIMGAFAMGQLTPALTNIAKARIAAYKLYQVIDRVPKVDLDKSGLTPEGGVRGEIEFKNVSFSYRDPESGQVTRHVFKNLNMKIAAGETVALVGASGSGKSTVGRMINRFYDPDEGSVTVDGIDLKEIDLKTLRGSVGIVSQEPLLFDTSIRDNITYGASNVESVTFEEIQEAARSANAHDFIMSNQFPEHYDTMVGSKGGKMSGGQKQRVAIARAILRNPPILILDEATSALDTKSERIVQNALDNLLGDDKARTTIIIAHRLSTVRGADRIIVIGEGKDGAIGGSTILEQGTHDELMLKEGAYFNLVGSQMGSGEDASNQVEKQEMNVTLTGQKDDSDTQSTRSDATSIAAQPGQQSKQKTSKAGKKKEKDVPNSRVWQLAKSDAPAVLAGVLFAIANGCLFPSLAFFFAEMITAYTIFDLELLRSDTLYWGAAFWFLAAISFVVNFFQIYLLTYVGERITERLRVILFRALLRQNIAFFDEPKHSAGILASELSTDASRVQLVTGPNLGATLNALTSMVFGCIVAFTASWKLAFVVLAASPLLGVGQGLAIYVMTSGEKGVQDILSDAVNIVAESVNGMKEVQAFEMQSLVHGMFSQRLDKPLSVSKKNALLTGCAMGFSQLISFNFYALTFWYGGQLIEGGEIQFESFMKALFALAFAAAGAGNATAFAGDQSKAAAARNRIFRRIDRVPPIDSKPWEDDGKIRPVDDRIIPADKFKGDIDIKNIYFAYPTRKNARVFDGLSLSIKAGQTVAFVGSSGSGKSSLVQLVERFYDAGDNVSRHSSQIEMAEDDAESQPLSPEVKVAGAISQQGGVITIDGVDIRDLDVKWLRRQIGLVGQEPKLFFGTIEENIAWGKPGATREDIVAAAKAANAHDFIEKIGGYGTQVGAGGCQLSGGQKQRVAIARAIIKNPKILLLDEATSALDNESEKIVQESLNKLLSEKDSQRTTIVIAHRLSTIRNADMIFVLDNDGKPKADENVHIKSERERFCVGFELFFYPY